MRLLLICCLCLTSLDLETKGQLWFLGWCGALLKQCNVASGSNNTSSWTNIGELPGLVSETQTRERKSSVLEEREHN
jgi:hypothetical protein